MRDWIGNRLKELNKTKAALAEHLGIAPARITELSHGKRSLQSHEILPFAQFMQMDPTHVLQLLENPNQELALDDNSPLVRTTAEFTQIPIRGEVAAGLWREIDDLSQDCWSENSQHHVEYTSTIALPGYPPEHQFGLYVRGESLNKIAPNGSVLHCLEYINGDSWHVKDGELVVVQRTKYQGAMIETTAKRVRRNGDIFELWPESNSPEFQEPLIVPEFLDPESTEEIRIFAKVLKILIEP